MISLADILFGEKREKNEKTNLKTNSAHNGENIKRKRCEDGKSNNTLKINKSDLSISETKTFAKNNHSIKLNNSSSSRTQEIKNTIQISKNNSNDTSIKMKVKTTSKNANSKEDRLLSNLKNFSSIDEILNDVKGNKEYLNLFKTGEKKDITPTEKPTQLQGNYKPTSTGEAKKLKKIDEINKVKESQEISILGKKHGNKSEIIRKNSNYRREDDIWCFKCKEFHHKDLHRKMPQPNYPLEISGKIREESSIKKNFPMTKKIPLNPSINENPIHHFSETSSSGKIILPKPYNKNDVINELKERIKINDLTSNNNSSNNNNLLSKSVKPSEEYKKQEIPLVKVKNYEVNNKLEDTKNKEKIHAIKKMIFNNKVEQTNRINLKKEIPCKQLNSDNFNKNQQLSNTINSQKPRPSLLTNQAEKFQLSNYNYSPTNPVSHNVYSRKDFDDEDDFIDDGDEEDPDNYRKYLDRINRKLRRGGSNYNYSQQDYSDSEEVIEARFDEIEEEEKYTEMIGQKEDEEEERREMLELERKKLKKLNKY